MKRERDPDAHVHLLGNETMYCVLCGAPAPKLIPARLATLELWNDGSRIKDQWDTLGIKDRRTGFARDPKDTLQ